MPSIRSFNKSIFALVSSTLRSNFLRFILFFKITFSESLNPYGLDDSKSPAPNTETSLARRVELINR
ncbi:hypothetical protein MNB_ARC-1_133 [hydrothermal vent metagenome]|uniref:Uncharacterized protein n=1 Tax=hydrothermal vent metagenome TaxID=652676 RepID=A0A3B1DRU3_9ZZZZ